MSTTTTTETEHHCNWCGTVISEDAEGAWIDHATDGDGCDASPSDVHEPQPTVRDFWQEGPHGESTYLDTTITPTADSPVSMTWRAIVSPHLVTSSDEPVTYRVDFYRTYHAAGTNVPDDGPWRMAGEPRVGWSSAEAAMTWAEKEEHSDAWDFDNDTLYKHQVELATAVQQAQAARDDRLAIDKIATLLGTSRDWNGDELEDIANIIGAVRPHPGDKEPAEYRAEFLAATGRTVHPSYNIDDED